MDFIICVYKIQLVRRAKTGLYSYVCVSLGCELFEIRLNNIFDYVSSEQYLHEIEAL